MVAIPFLLYDGVLFGDRHAAVGHLADLGRGRADRVVDGVLPAEGAAGDSGPREVTRSPGRLPGRALGARHAGGVRADLEHRLHRGALRHAACAAVQVPGVRYALSVLCFLPWIGWPVPGRGRP
jgi:hypothetical protein